MAQARPLVAEALRRHFGPIATKVLTSNEVRFEGQGYVYRFLVTIDTAGQFPAMEFHGSVHFDHVGRAMAEIVGENPRKYRDLSLHLGHRSVAERYAAKYGPPLDSRHPLRLSIMGDDYPDLHVARYRRIVEGDLLPLIEDLTSLAKYDALLNERPIRALPSCLHLVQQAERGVVARHLLDRSGWEALAAEYVTLLTPISADVKRSFTAVVDALRARGGDLPVDP